MVLLGPMGAGKTTLGLAMAGLLDANFVDSDQSILELTGRNAADIASLKGVPYLHRLERSLLVGLLSVSSRSVIAAAGSVIDDAPTREKMREHLCIWVEADAATLAKRRQSGSHRRDMTDDEAEDLNRVRRLSVADLVIGNVDTTSSKVEQSAALAMSLLAQHLPLLHDSE